MKKEYWLGIQKEILERRGIYKIYAFLVIFCCTVIVLPEIPVIAYSPQLLLDVIALVFLGIIWHMGKGTRAKKESRQLLWYFAFFLLMAVSSLCLIFR